MDFSRAWSKPSLALCLQTPSAVGRAVLPGTLQKPCDGHGVSQGHARAWGSG